MEIEKQELLSVLEFLDWSLSIMDEDFKETGKIGFAEMVVWKSARRILKEIKEKYEL